MAGWPRQGRACIQQSRVELKPVELADRPTADLGSGRQPTAIGCARTSPRIHPPRCGAFFAVRLLKGPHSKPETPYAYRQRRWRRATRSVRQRSATPAKLPVRSKAAPRAFRPMLSMSRARRRLLKLSDFHVSYERPVPFCIFLKSMKKLILDAQSTFSPNFIGVPLAQSKFSLMNTG